MSKDNKKEPPVYSKHALLIVSLLDLLKDIEVSDLEGKVEALHLQLQGIFNEQGRAFPEFSPRTLGRYIEKGLSPFKKNNGLT